MTDRAPTLADEIEATLQWWHAAGVDCNFANDATAWLAEPALPEASGATGEAQQASQPLADDIGSVSDVSEKTISPAVDLLGDSPPATLDEFREFWLNAPGLDSVGPRGRIPPRGAANPALMILVIDPEQGDSDRLLSGQQGRLLTNILASIGLSDNQVYFASALPRHTPMADTAAAAKAGLAAVLTHHIKLVAPERIIAFGGNILPLFLHGVTMDETSLREINQRGSSSFVLVSEDLDSIMAMPGLKARFWRRWNEWSAKS